VFNDCSRHMGMELDLDGLERHKKENLATFPDGAHNEVMKGRNEDNV
jgi:hypothetical protein